VSRALTGAISERDAARARAPSRLPLLYVAFAHLCLAYALGALAVSPQSFAGFFYHPRMIAVVHLVTLGWITAHILGSLYMIAPMALRTHLRTTRLDVAAFWAYAVGVTGMAAHFWIAETSGMLYGALLVLATILVVGTRVHIGLRAAPIESGIKLHYRLAFANIAGAGTLGLLLGWHRLHPFLRSEPLSGVYAHAHLAALGWATMTVFGSAYRLLPMMLPSAPPPATLTWGSALLLEAGVAGLAWSFLASSDAVAFFAALAAASIAWFLGVAGWMLRHRRRPGPGLPRIDFTRLHALQALLYLGATAALGVVLALAPRSEGSLRLAKVYGVCGLLGFFGSLILGVAGRHVPVLLWTRGMLLEGPPTASPYRLQHPAIAALQFVLWTAGVPLLAAALWREAAELLRPAAWMLFGAVAASAYNHVRVLRHPALRRAAVGAPGDERS
jgi:hypothetical protein